LETLPLVPLFRGKLIFDTTGLIGIDRKVDCVSKHAGE